MRKAFANYYVPSDADFDKRWEDGWFALDANILLNLYRYSKLAREELVEILKALGNRVWLPHQAGLEFHRNRLGVISERALACDDHVKTLKEFSENIKQGHEARFLPTEFLKDVEATIERWTTILKTVRHEMDNLFHSDLVLDTVTELFDGKIGPEPEEKNVLAWRDAAKKRYEARKPPGFMDAEGKKRKPEPDCFGDVVLWMELIEHAKREKKPVFLVVDDQTEDWWLEKGGKRLGPRPELVREMQQEAGVNFWQYDCQRFMEFAGRNLHKPVDAGTLEEAKAVSAALSIDQNELEALIYAHLKDADEQPPGTVSELLLRHEGTGKAGRLAGYRSLSLAAGRHRYRCLRCGWECEASDQGTIPLHICCPG